MNNIESRRSILFLDNDKVSREVVKSYLNDSYDIEVEENIEEALIKISKNKYDLILLDINLGVGMTGMDVLRFQRMSHLNSQTPSIAITAYAMEGDREEFIEAGFSDFLSKPFSRKDLKSMINKYFN